MKATIQFGGIGVRRAVRCIRTESPSPKIHHGITSVPTPYKVRFNNFWFRVCVDVSGGYYIMRQYAKLPVEIEDDGMQNRTA